MIGIWVIIGLILSAVCVSVLGAAFSVVGLGALFSGAMIAVWAMAGSLEFAKFVLAAYLHQRWKELNLVFRSYLTFAVVVLSLITSMGIFGFLSDAYQSSSHEIEEVNIKITNLKSQQKLNEAEILRLNKAIDEIPDSRVSKKIKARAEAEPRISALTKGSEEIDRKIGAANLQLHEIKKKIGPLVYIARATNRDIDTIVTCLILVFVSVFDPLAICLVIATSEALQARRRQKLNPPKAREESQAVADTVSLQTPSKLVEPQPPLVEPLATQSASNQPPAQPLVSATSTEGETVGGETVEEGKPALHAVHPPSFLAPGDEVIEMKYVDNENQKSG